MAMAIEGPDLVADGAPESQLGPDFLVVGFDVARTAEDLARPAAIDLLRLPAKDVGEGAVDEDDLRRGVSDVDGGITLVDRELAQLVPADIHCPYRPVQSHLVATRFCATFPHSTPKLRRRR